MSQKEMWKINELPEFRKEDIYEHVFLNQFGYYELQRKNTMQERNEHFVKSYFQEHVSASYEKEYSPEELDYLYNQLEEKAYVLEQNLQKMGRTGSYSILDIGCGEGFLLKFFHDRGKKVKGIDIGSYAVSHYNPEMLPFFEQGDMETLLPMMEERGEVYDVVNLDRCLDMVYDVDFCLDHIRNVMDRQSILIVKVANNYSNLQRMLLKKGDMKKEYWLDDPGHTGYFNREGLIARLDAKGLECMDFYGSTFVDLNLVNPRTNYYEKPEVGKAVHQSTVCIENMLHDISIERTIEIFRMLGDMGFGREIVGVFRKR